MKLRAGTLALSPTDLANHLACAHLTTLDLDAALGRREPPEYVALITATLRERGIAHENAYISHLRSRGEQVVDLRGEALNADGVAATLGHMRSGVDVIVQAPLIGGPWAGRADILQKVSIASDLGAWSYEPADTKLAAETKGGTILQMCTYADMLQELQGVPPDGFRVVTPGEPFRIEAYRLSDFRAYYRFVQGRLLERSVAGTGVATYPEPVAHCDICRWWEVCDEQRRRDDHLSYIAGISRLHREELVAQGIPTLRAAAAMPLPIPFTPSRGSRETLARIREQARVQHEQRTLKTPVHELLPIEEGQGLARLPPPSPGDLFLDLEGARYARHGGREYLFGIWTAAAGYEPSWAFDDQEERRAFERVMDRIGAALAADSGAHIYHYAPYEPAAFKRLMGRYATRAAQLDELLRAGRFVDLYAVVRRALRAGVESYSIKQLEPFYAFVREMPLRDASAHLHAIEVGLERDALDAVSDESRAAVATYNRDDCRSTAGLRDWLERLRSELEAAGTTVPRPTLADAEAPRQVGDLDAQQQAVRARLLDGLPEQAAASDHPQHWRWQFAYLLDWHRREEKSAWWEYFRIRELPESDLFDEPKAIAGLVYEQRVEVILNARGKPTGSVIDRYSYPEQDAEIGKKGKLSMPGADRIGDVAGHDRGARTISIRKGPATADVHPTAIFEGDVVPSAVQQKALLRLADRLETEACGTDLLLMRPPRVRDGVFGPPRAGETVVDCAVRLALQLDRTTLAIQGPPGAGKTYVGAQMIRALAGVGKRVGVTAVSHRVIRNLLDAVLTQEREEPREGSQPLRVGHKCDEGDIPDDVESKDVTEFGDNADARDAIETGQVQVLGGTAWLWAREDFADAVDVLFVDEAGQMSLANALAVSGAASSMVLLGDPQQLEQPQKGSHPDGVDVSALEHVLGAAATMPPERGLFLPTTWRLHPDVCAYTSELFYEGKLQPLPGLERQALAGTDGFDGSGLWWYPVEHDGNQNFSVEEVESVAALVDRLLRPGARWQDAAGVLRPLGAGDLRIVAPYNAQVNRLAERLEGRGVPVGTVDKFQGQEAPVVIYSMATSRPEDAPRGMEFLYSLNRLNVATSRARCAAILVASPRLLEPACRTPRQMQLANALCRYVERAGKAEIA